MIVWVVGSTVCIGLAVYLATVGYLLPSYLCVAYAGFCGWAGAEMS